MNNTRRIALFASSTAFVAIIVAACGGEGDAGSAADESALLAGANEDGPVDAAEEGLPFNEGLAVCFQKCGGDRWDLNVCPPFCAGLISGSMGDDGQNGQPHGDNGDGDDTGANENDGRGSSHADSAGQPSSGSSGTCGTPPGGGGGAGGGGGGGGGGW